MVLGPFYRQVLLLGDDSRLFRAWRMYSNAGADVRDAEFRQHLPNGSVLTLDRYEVLGYARPREAPRFLWRIKGKSGVWRVAQELCAQLGPDADIRAVSRRGTRSGWKAEYAGELDLCTTPRPTRTYSSEAPVR